MNSTDVTMVTTADGTELACRYLPGSGNLIIALHGFTGNGRTMEPLMEAVRDGRPAVLVDIIGHGQSAAPDHVEHYAMASVVDQVLSLLGNHAPLTVHLIGYSMGGRIALSMAARAPWYFASISLLSSTAGIADPAERAERYDQDQSLAAMLQTQGVADFTHDWLSHDLFAPYLATLDEAGKKATIEQRTAATAVGLSNSLRGTGTGSMAPLWHLLPSVRSPLLAIAGGLDTKYSSIAEDLASGAANGKFEVIPDVGHVVHHENLPEVASILRGFLTECESHADHER